MPTTHTNTHNNGQNKETKNRHHDLAGSSAVGGSLERGVVARGGRLEQARGGQRQIAREESACLGSLPAVQAPAPHAPALTDDVMCWTLAKYLERRVTSAKRGRWAESKMLWLGGDQLVGALKKAGWIAPPLDAPRRSSAHSCIATSKVRLELLRTKDEDSSETRQADGDPRRGGSASSTNNY